MHARLYVDHPELRAVRVIGVAMGRRLVRLVSLDSIYSGGTSIT